MPRVTNAVASRRRRKRTLKLARGYFGNKSKLPRYANEALNHAGQYAYKHRKMKKGQWRGLWIARVNVACRANGITYSRFIEGLAAAGIELNRKSLADLAVRDAAGFTAVVEQARTALKAKAAPAS
jgi:large subunit ribosomal protein L20